jgi:hypothetical protein
MSKEIVVKKNNSVVGLKNYSLDKMSEISSMAIILKDYVIKNNLYTNIQGKNYTHVDAWQVSGGMLGLFPRVSKITDLSKVGEIKWLAEVEIVNREDKVMSRGFAICSSKEVKKVKFDEYAILSMAQTRAIGRAYRNTIGYVMKLAGYESTPSEEMHKVGETPKTTIIQAENVSQETQKKEGQIKGPDGEWTFVCAKDGDPISQAVADFSMKKVGKRLCREHLLELSAKKSKK